MTKVNSNIISDFQNKKHISSSMDLWVEEKHGNHFATRFRCQKVLFSGRSVYQNIDVVETHNQGRLLLNDGIVMLSDQDEQVYHEMITHVPLFTHSKPCSVLIIGGGDGGTAREVLRHLTVRQCVNVEIDEMVVEVCKKYFPRLANSFSDQRVNLKIQDGALFVKNTRQTFDVVLVDSTDPLGPSKPLFSEAFYKNVFRILSPDGILVVQAESPLFKREREAQKYILQSVGFVFPLVNLYHYSNVVYPGGLWSFALASKKYCPVKDFRKNKACSIKNWNLQYYNTDIHQSAFAQPEFLKKEFGNLFKQPLR